MQRVSIEGSVSLTDRLSGCFVTQYRRISGSCQICEGVVVEAVRLAL